MRRKLSKTGSRLLTGRFVWGQYPLGAPISSPSPNLVNIPKNPLQFVVFKLFIGMENNTVCKWCKNGIYKCPSRLEGHKTHFCNAKCRKQYELSLTTSVNLKCSYCNSDILRRRNELRKSFHKTYFCNNVCKNRYLNTIRWKDVSSTRSHRHKRKIVLQKYNNECVACGYDKDVRMIDLHHIDGNHQNNDINNLWSVCVWCHQRHHRCKEKISIGVWRNSSVRVLGT